MTQCCYGAGIVPARGSACVRGGHKCHDTNVRAGCPGGELRSGMCPGQSNVKCCVGGSDQSPLAVDRSVRPVARPERTSTERRGADDTVEDAERRSESDTLGRTANCRGVECVATRSSVQVSVGQRAIDYVRKELLEPVLQSDKVMGEEADFFKDLPDAERIKNAKLGVKVRLDKCFLKHIEIDEDRTNIDFVPASNLIDIDLRGLKLLFRLEIGYDGVFSRTFKKRVVEVQVDQARFKSIFRVGWKYERPSIVSVTEPNLVLDRRHFDIRILSGDKEKKGWFINFIIDLLEGLVTRIAKRKVAEEFNKQVNPMMEGLMKSLPVRHQVPAIEILKTVPFVIDTRLSQAPIVTDRGLNLLFKGTAFKEGGSCTGCPMPRITVADSDKFAHVRISEHLPCCVARTVHAMGALKITQEVPRPEIKIESELVGQAANRAVGNLIGAVFNAFTIKYKVDMPTAPEVRFTAEGVKVYAEAVVEVHLVKNSAKDVMDASTLYVSAHAKAAGIATVSIAGNLMSYQLSDVDAQIERFELRNHAIDETIRAPINKFINWVLDRDVIAKVNEAMKAGYSIPSMHGLTFVGAEVKLHDGFIDIGTDATFKMPEQEVLEMYLAMAM
jgi:hypothetical protein